MMCKKKSTASGSDHSKQQQQQQQREVYFERTHFVDISKNRVNGIISSLNVQASLSGALSCFYKRNTRLKFVCLLSRAGKN